MIKAALSRRKIFQFAPAAALAAPTLAQDVAVSAPMHGPPGVMSMAGMQYGSPQWLANEKSRLQSLILGQPDEEEEMYQRFNTSLVDARHFDGLRSVSATQKARMFMDHNKRRNRERQREGARFSLARLLKGQF